VILPESYEKGLFFFRYETETETGRGVVDLENLHLKSYTMKYQEPLFPFDLLNNTYPYTLEGCIFENINLNNNSLIQYTSQKLSIIQCIFKNFGVTSCLLHSLDTTGGIVELIECQFTNFYRHEDGGVMFLLNVNLNLDTCVFDNCWTDHDGGGCFVIVCVLCCWL
jgi:hypothetical protein